MIFGRKLLQVKLDCERSVRMDAEARARHLQAKYETADRENLFLKDALAEAGRTIQRLRASS